MHHFKGDSCWPPCCLIPTVTVGSTATTPPGTRARVTAAPTPCGVELDFAIPRGRPGPQGPQGEQGPAGPQGNGGLPGLKDPKDLPGLRGNKGPKAPRVSRDPLDHRANKGLRAPLGPKDPKASRGNRDLPGPPGRMSMRPLWPLCSSSPMGRPSPLLRR